eukprot:c17499_g1_i1 orf=219-839(+)
MELIEIDIGAHRIDALAASYLLKQLVEFVLFMHHQVPDTIEHLQRKWEDLDVDSNNGQPSNQRQQRGRVRKAVRETKKLRKLTESIQNLISAAREAIQGLPGISSLLLLLGSSPSRPQQAYEVQLFITTSELKTDESCKEMGINAQNLSRKLIRALISHDAGSFSLGPTKLFLMVKAPASSSVPQNFLPKQNYALMNKKVSMQACG